MNGQRSKCREQTLIGTASHTLISHTYRNLFSFMCANRFLYKQSSSTPLIGLHNYCTILKIVAQASKFLLEWQPLSHWASEASPTWVIHLGFFIYYYYYRTYVGDCVAPFFFFYSVRCAQYKVHAQCSFAALAPHMPCMLLVATYFIQ